MTVTTRHLPVDSTAFFEALAERMNADPERYRPLGFCDLDLGVVIHRPSSEDFRALVRFADYGCLGVEAFPEGAEDRASCWLEGDLGTWEEMVADIRANGRATARRTLASLVLLGDRIGLRGDDSMGVDRFFRYAATVQQFIDGAADSVSVPA
jgi:hypothetical protein